MKNELNWNMLYQISEAITKIKKIRHTKKFQNKIDKMILEYQNEFSERNLTIENGKFCIVIQVIKNDKKPFLSEVFLNDEEIKKGCFYSFEQPSEQLYCYGEVIKIFWE